ncbi:alpha/beta fold hydrolase [Streptomyces zingiberis]|uniref:Alpha/beta fold hydrolase n=1 Tax=Streptomyces zingiberis TaxID=2053010 RepID=A0ABX1BYT1_9ACTN|nr:alpha/beta fold hydrolase [Streptomyces zingiberis]NJQ02820.1 alpha/beta fold hydrolase [Streptomyces zingiberis]
MGHPRRKPLRASTAGLASATVLASTALGLAPASAAQAAGAAAPAAAPASTAVSAVTVAGDPGGTAAAPAVSPATASAPTSASASVRFVRIPGHGGTELAANVVTPSGHDGSRRLPLVVLPTSWAVPQVEYLAQARKLADTGYVVLSYNSRGFWQSGGEIEVAGAEDLGDASAVIDWALAHTPADPGAIGMAGVSYGAGISLLAAAFDDRIKAVAALSGWADLVGAIYSGRTQHLQAAAMLTGAGHLTGRPGDELTAVLDGFFSSDLSREAAMIEWGRTRSPATYADRINANGAAIMLGNAWGDSIFPPNQYADFFERLTVDKRLEFRPGDHATPEAGGLLGLDNDTWTSTRRWLDHHLKGEANGVDREAPVRLVSRSGGGDESYPDWKSVAAKTERVPLSATREINTNLDSGANGGTVLLSGALDQFLKLPPAVSVPLLPRSLAAVWQSERYRAERRIRGAVTLHTTVTGNKSSGTAVAHLYDVGPLGVGRLVTHAPVTFHDRTPGVPFPVDLELYATAYDVPAGHRLALVIDSVDPLYAEHNPSGARLTFSSPAGDPSHVSVPFRE